MEGDPPSQVPPSVEQLCCTIWITSFQPQKTLSWKKKKQPTIHLKASTSTCGLNIGLEAASLIALESYCPFISLRAGSHHSLFMGEERWGRLKIFHPVNCHSDSRGSFSILPLWKKRNSRLSERLLEGGIVQGALSGLQPVFSILPQPL